MNAKKNSPRQKTEILIVEDSRTQAEQLKHILEKHHYMVAVANDGKQALSLFSEHKPALVISDIIMPEMNGYELCKSIKTNFGDEEIPVILLTSLSDAEDVLEGLACGADNFITKPYSEDYILSSISQILANRDLRKGERIRIGVEIVFGGKKRFITAEQQQMLTLLISSYEAAVHKNKELTQTQEKLRLMNENLEKLVEKRTATLSEEIEKRKQTELQIKTALDELKSSEENFRRSLEDSPLGVRVATTTGETFYANKVLLDIYGYANVEELNKIPVKERYTPQSYAESQMRKKDRKRGDFGPSVYEINIVRKNKEIRHLQVLRKEIFWNGTKQFQVIYQDITERKEIEAGLEKTRKELAVIKKNAEASEFAESVINTVREPLLALDQNLRVVKVNRSFYNFFKVKPEDTVGQLIYDLGNKQWDIPKLRELLETILPQKASFDNYEVEHEFTTIGRRVMLLNARQIQQALGKERIILLAIEDITERKDIEAGLEKTRKELTVIKKAADEASEFAESVINTVREPLLALDQNLRVVKVSRSFYDFFKVKPEETLGKLIYDLGNKQWDIPKLRELLETILPQKASFDNYEVEHEFTTIGRRVMLLNARQIQQALGKERIILLAIEDITERKKAEEMNARHFATVVLDSNDAIIVYDFEGRIITWNRGAELIYGYSREEVLQMNYSCLIPPGKMVEYKEFTRRQLEGEMVASLETQRVTKDGRLLDVWLTMTKIEDDAGKPVGIASTGRDITERKRAEAQREAAVEALRVSEKKLNEAQALGQIGNWEFDINTQKITWSKQVYKLYERDPVLGPPTTEEEAAYYSPEQAQTLRGYTRNAIETGQFFEYDLQATLPSGKQVYLAARMRPIKDAQGRVIKLFGILQDITERKRVEEQIESQLEELKRWQDVMLGREDRVLDLKREVNELLGKAGQPPRYPSASSQDKKEK